VNRPVGAPRNPSYARAWALLATTHATATLIVALLAKLDPPAWLRDPMGVFGVFTMYGPIALATTLGATRSTFERAAWLFGEITPAGWVLVVSCWLAAHALLAWAWVAWRRRR
jgi:hypothetical protein